MATSDCFSSLTLHMNWNYLLHLNRTIAPSPFSCLGLGSGSCSISAIGPLILLLWSILGPAIRRMGRKPEGEGFRPQVGQGEGRPPTDRRPVDRRPPRRFERPAGDAGEKPEGGEFSVEKWVYQQTFWLKYMRRRLHLPLLFAILAQHEAIVERTMGRGSF